ncbi:MAG: A/G-specific adenine glycosylase [Flavobacteriaceae bacterium]
MTWTDLLLNWYSENKRFFEWRKTREPYKIWLSEIILQQTRTSQGLPYYNRFIQTFPTLEDLALASEDEVLKLWQGLGYYSRARNLHATARFIYDECGGVFPNTFEKLLELKGVGDYTASAIASICFNIPQAVVDGNVYRFLSRYFGITTPINSGVGKREFKAKAMELIDSNRPGEFNQSLMEFGSVQCKPQSPNCGVCPFSMDCFAFNHHQIDRLPIKNKKLEKTNRYFNYLVVSDSKDHFLLEKRVQKGIWQNLFQFPLVETQSIPENLSDLITEETFPKELIPLQQRFSLWNSQPITHKLSHQNLFIHFWVLSTPENLPQGIPKKELENFAVPIVIHNFLNVFFK